MKDSMTLYFLIAGISVFRFLETWTDKPGLSKQNPARILLEETVFFAAIALAAAVYLFGIRYAPSFSDVFFLSAFPALYFVFRLKNYPDSFPAGVFTFLSLFVFPVGILSVGALMKSAVELALGIMLMRLALEGIRFRLLFSNIPKPFKGVAAFLVSAGLVSMAFSAFFIGLR